MKKKVVCPKCEGNGYIGKYEINDYGCSAWSERCVECEKCHPDDEGCAKEILKWLNKEAKDGCL